MVDDYASLTKENTMMQSRLLELNKQTKIVRKGAVWSTNFKISVWFYMRKVYNKHVNYYVILMTERFIAMWAFMGCHQCVEAHCNPWKWSKSVSL